MKNLTNYPSWFFLHHVRLKFSNEFVNPFFKGFEKRQFPKSDPSHVNVALCQGKAPVSSFKSKENIGIDLEWLLNSIFEVHKWANCIKPRSISKSLRKKVPQNVWAGTKNIIGKLSRRWNWATVSFSAFAIQAPHSSTADQKWNKPKTGIFRMKTRTSK